MRPDRAAPADYQAHEILGGVQAGDRRLVIRIGDISQAPARGLSGRYAIGSGLAATAGGNTQAGEASANKGEGGGFGNLNILNDIRELVGAKFEGS